MTNPEREEESVLAEAEAFEDEPAENPILGWAKAIVFGIGDTAKDVLAEGRRGAREAMEQGWDRFDQKTKHRRS
ncbi:MAG: hypothetical protein IPN07_03145 [Dehalococcoidia bacterium]|nr:hypothetical protein [Dehalococcoidia bacterium]